MTRPRRQEPWERLIAELLEVPLSTLASMRPPVARQHVREFYQQRERRRDDANSTVCEQQGCVVCGPCAAGARVAFEDGESSCGCCNGSEGEHTAGCAYALGYDAEARAEHMATGLDALAVRGRDSVPGGMLP